MPKLETETLPTRTWHAVIRYHVQIDADTKQGAQERLQDLGLDAGFIMETPEIEYLYESDKIPYCSGYKQRHYANEHGE
jgi:hypothetical protein